MITYVNDSSVKSDTVTTSQTVNVPTGTVNGDFMLWVKVSQTNDTPTTPTGWNILDNEPRTALSYHVFWRWASSEPATYTMSGMTNTKHMSSVHTFRGVDTTTPFDTAFVQATSTTTQVAFPSITPVTNGAWVVAIRTANTATGVATPTGWASSNMTLKVSHSTAGTGANPSEAVAVTELAVAGAFTPNLSYATGTTTQNRTFATALRPAPSTSYRGWGLPAR